MKCLTHIYAKCVSRLSRQYVPCAWVIHATIARMKATTGYCNTQHQVLYQKVSEPCLFWVMASTNLKPGQPIPHLPPTSPFRYRERRKEIDPMSVTRCKKVTKEHEEIIQCHSLEHLCPALEVDISIRETDREEGENGVEWEESADAHNSEPSG